MKNSKKILFALVLALFALFVTACSSSKNDAEGSNKTGELSGEIVMWHSFTQGPRLESIQKSADEFMKKHPKVKIKIETFSWNDFYTKWTTGLANGNVPDISTALPNQVMEMVNSDALVPLNDTVKKIGEDKFNKTALDEAKVDGNFYSVPLYSHAQVMWVRTDLLKQYNIEVPKTLEDLEKACDTFLENGITPFTLANSTKWTGSMYFQCLAARKGGLEPFQKAADGTGSFEDESFEWAGEKIQEWVNKGYFPDGFNSMSEDDGQSRQLFYQETAAMYLIGSWATANLKTDSEDGGSDFYDKVGWFSFPAISDSNADSSILCGTMGDQFISFNCEGEKLDAAFELASYLSSEEVVDFMVESSLIPPVKGIEDKITDPVSKSIVEAANNASAVQLWYDQYLDPSVANAHLDGNQEVFGLTMTPAEANKKMQDAQQEYLNK